MNSQWKTLRTTDDLDLPYYVVSPDPGIYESDKYTCLDFETTNLDKGWAGNTDNRLLLAAWSKQHDVYCKENSNGTDFTESLFGRLGEVDFFIAHNAKFELQWLLRLGYPIEKLLVWDTMIAEYVRYGNVRVPLDLGSVSKRYGLGGKAPYVDICMKAGVCPSEMPKSWLQERVTKDVEQTEQIFLQQRDLLQESGRLPTVYTRCLLTPVLADIESNGMCLDEHRVIQTHREHQAEAQRCRQELDEVTGGINLNSRPQLGEYLYDTLGFDQLTDRRGNTITTGAGQRKTDSDTLAKLVANTPEQHRFIEIYGRYNAARSALSKNLEFFLGVVTEDGGIFYGQFNQTVTATHRLSSSGRKKLFKQFQKPKSVQFQNLPRGFKRLFTTRKPDWLFAEIDGAQLEFRVAAHLGHDAVATDSIRSGFDVHSYTASVLTEHGQETNRQGAKQHTFKPLYGGKSGTRAEQAYYAAFRERYPGISGIQEEWLDTVVRDKELQIPSGLKFFWPQCKRDHNTGYVDFTPSICNYPVQSYATADIIPIAIVYLWHCMKAAEMQSFLINTVHDSVEGEIHPDEVEQFKLIAFEAFTDYVYFYLDVVYDDQFSVPLGAELKLGTHWGEGEEEKHSVEPPFMEAD